MSGNATNATAIPEFPVWFKTGLVIVGVLTLFGNGLVVFFIATRERLQTKTNIMVASLAVSDLVVGFGIVPSFLTCMYEECDNLLSKLFYDAFLFVSVANLCCITFDRFLAVTRPLHYHMEVTRKSVIILITVSWIVPSVVSLVPVTWLYTDTSRETQTTNNKIFYTLQVVVFMFFPCLVMLITYAVILNIAWRQSKNIRQERMTVGSVTSLPSTTSLSTTTSTREAKATLQVFGTVVLMFVVCWIMSAFRTIVTQYSLMDVPTNLTNASRLLLVANSAVNPIIYALWKKDIKNEIKKLLKLNSRLVRPANFRSSNESDGRRSRSNSTAEPGAAEKKNGKTIAENRNGKSKAEKRSPETSEQTQHKHNSLQNGIVNEGLTSAEIIEIKTVPEKATSTQTEEPLALGIDNLVAQADGMV